MSQTSPVSGLPHNWEYDEKTDCVICGGCCFRFGAEHPEGNGSGWLCPNCGDGNGKSELPAVTKSDLAQRPTREQIAKIISPDWFSEYSDALNNYEGQDVRQRNSALERADKILALLSDTSTVGNSKRDNADYKIGRWLSAALEDPAVCAEMKADINAWFEAHQPGLVMSLADSSPIRPTGGK